MRSIKNIGLCMLLFLFLGSLPACSGSLLRNYGRILPVGWEARDLENGVVNPELRYYISGSDVYPIALIGLNRNHRLDPKTLWKEVAMTPKKLREIVGLMKAKAFEYGQFPHEFKLLDTGGQKIGFWYSLLTATTYIHFGEDGAVILPTPDHDTYEKLEPKNDDD